MGNIGSSPTDNNWYYQSFFADTDFIHLYLYTIIVTLFNRSESDLRIRLLQNNSRIYFHFYVKPIKLKQHEFEEQLYNK